MDQSEQSATQVLVRVADGMRPYADEIARAAIRAIGRAGGAVVPGAVGLGRRAVDIGLSAVDGLGTTGLVDISFLKRRSGTLEVAEVPEGFPLKDFRALGRACRRYGVAFAVVTEGDGSRSFVFESSSASVVLRCLSIVLGNAAQQQGAPASPAPTAAEVDAARPGKGTEGVRFEPVDGGLEGVLEQGAEVAVCDLGAARAVLEAHTDGSSSVTVVEGGRPRVYVLPADEAAPDLRSAREAAVATLLSTEAYQLAHPDEDSQRRSLSASSIESAARDAQTLEPDAQAAAEAVTEGDQLPLPLAMSESQEAHAHALAEAGVLDPSELEGEGQERPSFARAAAVIAEAEGRAAVPKAEQAIASAPLRGMSSEELLAGVRASLATHHQRGAGGRTISALNRGTMKPFEFDPGPAHAARKRGA